MAKRIAKKKKVAGRRDDALSRGRIIDEAVALLDDEGQEGLTFRALGKRLSTGPGAIYWHVANKGELLAAASDAIVARAMAGAAIKGSPRRAIRAIAIAIFDLVDAHPWLGAQLSRGPWQSATMQIFERIGQQLQALGTRSGAQFTAACALVSYVLGASDQNAANGLFAKDRRLESPADRTAFLAAISAQWQELDAGEYPFTRKVAAQFRKHDDRAELLAGVNLILAGIAASR